jgi:isoleucyl-tRNA synthetase
VLDILFHALVRYAAPVLVFTAEEVWQTRFPDEKESVHFLEWPVLPLTRHPVLDTGLGLSSAEQSLTPDQVRGDELMKRWTKLRSLRSQINEAIEPLRRDKTLGSSLEANVSIGNFAGLTTEITDLALLEEVFIVAEVKDRDDTGALEVTKTTNHKCGRCWRHLPEVSEDGSLCNRCDSVVKG